MFEAQTNVPHVQNLSKATDGSASQILHRRLFLLFRL